MIFRSIILYEYSGVIITPTKLPPTTIISQITQMKAAVQSYCLLIVALVLVLVLITSIIAPSLKTLGAIVLVGVILIRTLVVDVVLVVHFTGCLLGVVMSTLAVIGVHA